MRTPLLAATLLGLCLLAPAAARAAPPPLSEAQVRTFMAGVERASRERDLGRLAATLAPDCRIELRTSIGGQESVTLLTRSEYLELLTSGYAAMKDLEQYDYRVGAEHVVLERDPPAATVVSEITETVTFGGQHQVTRSEETTRVERRGDALKIVAVSALTTGR